MSAAFDAFVSYSREDAAFARRLVARLRRCGLAVWIDEEQIRPGDRVQDGVNHGLENSRHAILIVSDAWLESRWTRWEGERLFTDRPAGRRVVPILRFPRDIKKIGPDLASLHAVYWLEGDPDQDTRFWEVYCGLGLASPGPRESWAESGRRVLSAGPGDPTPRRQTSVEKEGWVRHRMQTGISRLALNCDRAAQWGEFVEFSTTPDDGAFLVRGEYRQGHALFAERIRQCLPKDPRRRIRTIRWGPFPPLAKGTAFDALAKALDCRSEDLVAILRSQLADQNLVLLHSPVLEFRGVDDDVLAAYYSQWLPELVEEVDGPGDGDFRLRSDRGGLKVVQCVSWHRAPRILSALAKLFRLLGVTRLDWVERALEGDGAMKMLRRIERSSAPNFPVVVSSTLRDITREDVEAWSRKLPPELDSRRYVETALNGTGDSADTLQRIVEALGQALPSSRTARIEPARIEPARIEPARLESDPGSLNYPASGR